MSRIDAVSVYSSESGRLCPKCGKPASACRCPRKSASKAAPAPAVPKDGIVRLARETKGRGGKGVTLIYGVPLEGEELKNLAKELKQKCGTGGTLKDGVIEIRGDHRDLLLSVLEAKGFKVKKAGG